MVGETKTIFTVIPKISSLKYYLGMIDPSEEKDKSAPTDFQWQILKARFFIWKNPELLAAPVHRRTSHIHIIIGNDFEDRIRERAKDQKLILSGPYKLDEYIYQECINYTLTFRLAPQWHKIENHFVFSNDFLSSEEPMEGIKFGLSVIDDILRMTATMQRVRLPLLNLQELGVNLERLRTTGKAPIHQTVYILPQLKKGTAVDIQTKIPDECPFQTYSQLRRHWKNTHGYRLPHDEEGMLYVRVSFGWNNTPYSYPVVCTRPGKLHPLKSKYPDLVLTKFGEHMMKRCPTICGKEINLFVEEQDSSFPLSNLISTKEGSEEPKKKGKSSGKAAKSVPVFTQDPEDVANLDNTQGIPFSLDKSIPNVRIPQQICARLPVPASGMIAKPVGIQILKAIPTKVPEPASGMIAKPVEIQIVQKIPTKVPEPIQTVNITTINTPHRPPASASITSTPISSTSVLKSAPEFVPILSPIPSEPPTTCQTIPGNRVIIVKKPLSEVNAVKRLQPSVPEEIVKSVAPVETLKSTAQEDAEPAAKKPSGNSEIENLARAKALYKINVPILKNFCKENNIAFLTKDRKDAIMQRIYDFYGV